MASFDIAKIKPTWKGYFQQETAYKKNDVVFYNGSAYACIKDMDEYTIRGGQSVETNFYGTEMPDFVIVTYPPYNTEYWTQITRGVNYRGMWMPHRMWKVGDVTEYGGSLYICIKDGRNSCPVNPWRDIKNNVYVDYWQLIAKGVNYNQWNRMAQLTTTGPMGWTENNGGNGNLSAGIYTHSNGIDMEGNVVNSSGWSTNGNFGIGDGAGSSEFKTNPGFTFVDWRRSTDNGGTGTMTTPDGEFPKCVQLEGGRGYNKALFNNGEVYAWGYSGNGEGGWGNNSNYNRPHRCTNTNQVDWLSTPVTKSFNESKIVKIACSGGNDDSNAHHTLALTEDGRVFSWGYNAYGQLGLGTNTADATNNNNRTSSQNRPQQIPTKYFVDPETKQEVKIVDVYACGQEYGISFFRDENDYLWSCGHYSNGTRGSGGSSDNLSYPTRLGKPWPNIKKFMCQARDGYGAAILLDHNGNMYSWGYDEGYGGPLLNYNTEFNSRTHEVPIPARDPMANSGRIDDFWLLGDGRWMWCIVKDWIGDMYGLGRNDRHNLGQPNNRSNSVPRLSFIPGPKNCCHVVGNNPQGYDGSVYPGTFFLQEDGRAWHSGNSNYGSGGHATSGNPVNWDWRYQEGKPGQENFVEPVWQYSQRITDIQAGGRTDQTDRDMAWWIGHNGTYLMSGYDGENGYHILQGDTWTYRYYNQFGNPGAYHRYTIHNINGD
jgi:hypothetical protein